MSRDALIVGINSYQYLPPLKAPAEDAEAIAQCLEQDNVFTARRMPERIETGDRRQPVVSSTQAVSVKQLKEELSQLFLPESQQAPETGLFYFSGHGLADKEGYDKGYLAASDTNPKDPSSAISLRWLQWLLSESPVKQQIIWLDCCHSGALIVNVGAANPGDGESRDRCFIASSRNFENAWEDLNSPYSVMTKALLDGLDPTRIPGQWVNTFDLAAYVNQALKGELQTPVCTNFGEAIDLTRAWQETVENDLATRVDSGRCPYKGLEFFDCNDEDPQYFFGRERLVGQLLDHVRTQPFLALVGASGNGKSSVLRAGLLHQLKSGRRIAGSDQWQILITRPDAQPMKNLAEAFLPGGGSQLDRAEALGRAEGLLAEGAAGLQRLVQASVEPRTLLVIDQFEEVFTRCESDEERSQYFQCLMGALAEARDKFCLIIAMRADFVGKCLAQEYSGLAQRLSDQMVNVLPLNKEELRAAICKPAERVNLGVEPALVTEILNDIQDAPGSLPLLQYTLKELWQRRENGQLKLAAYQTLGGISGTLDQRATEIYNRFGSDQQRTARHIFQQLTQLGEGTEDTRRRVFLENLIAEPLHPSERVKQVIDTLADTENRLLVTSEVVGKGAATVGKAPERRAIVDVAHEALIRHWRLLRRWIEQNRDLLRQQRRIEASTVAWQERGKNKGYLLQGILLTEAIQFQEKQAESFPLSDTAKEFIQKSVWQRRWGRAKTASWLIIPATLIVGLVEYNIHEARINADYARLDSESQYEERQAVQGLVAGCALQERYRIVPHYLAERFLGHCRPLENARLSEADLSSTYLNSANLDDANLNDANLNGAIISFANLNGADLNGANLSGALLSNAFLFSADLDGADLSDAFLLSADLSIANLSNADLSNADLSNVNLVGVNLSNTILLATNLRSSTNLTQQQLTGKNPPFICNSPLPGDIELKVGINRDCDRVAEILFERYPNIFGTLDKAQQYVEEAQKKTWE